MLDNQLPQRTMGPTTVFLCKPPHERQQDEAGKQDFLRRYQGHLLECCRRQGIRQEDAEDLTQDVLVRLWTKVQGDFTYEPQDKPGGFRAYARAAIRNAICELRRKYAQRRDKLLAGHERLDAYRPDNLFVLFVEECEKAAFKRVRDKVATCTPERDWLIFVAIEDENSTFAEIADRAGVGVTTAWQAHQRVSARIKAEIDRSAGG